MMCMLYCCFVKQKTAYEMRISDWSSDVCSSDLARFDLRIGMIAERGDATAGGADQRREATADLRAELKVRPGLRGRDDDDVVETDDLHAEQRQVELLTDAVQRRLHEIIEAVAPQPVARQRQHAGLQRIALGVGIERDEFLGDQCAQPIQASTRHQAEFTREDRKSTRLNSSH